VLCTRTGSVKERGPAYWLKKAIRARIGASKYPEDRVALENVAEMYEHIAEQMAEFSNHSTAHRPPYRRGKRSAAAR